MIRRSTVSSLLTASALLASSLFIGVSSASADDKVPYKDANASGSITLCDQDLKPITEGSIADLPFIWRGVSSEEAPAPYNGNPMRATLFIAQPRQGVPASGWTSNQVTAASIYHVQASPMAQSTKLDHPLWVNLDQYPARWDGFLQLRLLYSTTNAPLSTVYAATNIQVKGSTWHAVDAGNASCGAPDDAVSVESSVISQFQNEVKKHIKQYGPEGQLTKAYFQAAGLKTEPSSGPSDSPSLDNSGQAAPPVSSSNSTGGGASGPSRAWTSIGVLAALVLAGGAAALVWRRQAGHS